MKTNVKALDSFVHGRVHMTAGDKYEFSKGEAEELQKAGLVEIVGQEEDAPEPAAQVEEVTQPVADEQGAKMTEAPENKMADAPENKGAARKTTAKK